VLDAAGHEVREVETSFAMVLKSLAWLPVMVSDGGNQIAGRLEVGSKLFVKSSEAERLLAGHVSYLLPDPLVTSTLAEFLGIQHSISVDFVAELLKSWCDRHGQSSTPATFRTSLQHMQAVYQFLDLQMTKHQLQELLRNHPVIFYPVGDVVEGQFLYRSEVVWADDTRLFEKYRESLLSADPASAKLYRYPLCVVYRDMEDFFTRTMCVLRSPGIPELVELLIHIASTSVVSKALPDVLAIFSVIGRALLANSDVIGQARDSVIDESLRRQMKRLKAEKVIPGKNGSWLHLDCRPMIADDRQLEKMFPQDAAVFFVDCGEKLGIGNSRKKPGHTGLSLSLTAVYSVILQYCYYTYFKCLIL